jgi:hypothetical protein
MHERKLQSCIVMRCSAYSLGRIASRIGCELSEVAYGRVDAEG